MNLVVIGHQIEVETQRLTKAVQDAGYLDLADEAAALAGQACGGDDEVVDIVRGTLDRLGQDLQAGNDDWPDAASNVFPMRLAGLEA